MPKLSSDCRDRIATGQLIDGFSAIWRTESEQGWIHHGYQGAKCLLVVIACLARVVNGGSRIERAYAQGRGRDAAGLHGVVILSLLSPQTPQRRDAADVKP